MGPSSTELTCPKCHGVMRTYERSGIHVDQCGECRGVFLDRGELDRLLDAEASGLVAAARPSTHDRRPDDRRHDDRRHDDRRYDDRRHDDRRYDEHRHHKKRGGFLSELFD